LGLGDAALECLEQVQYWQFFFLCRRFQQALVLLGLEQQLEPVSLVVVVVRPSERLTGRLDEQARHLPFFFQDCFFASFAFQAGPRAQFVRYAELFGEPTRVGNKVWLIKRIAWRLQTLTEGDLSERARRRAEELANDADLRLSPPRNLPSARTLAQRAEAARLPPGWDHRLPPPGSLLNRRYKGRLLQVKILTNGVELEGKRYRSLCALAKAV
jgi:hypothetical protein